MTGLRTKMVAAMSLFVLVAAGPREAPVADAAQMGDADAVRELLRQGSDVNGAQADGLTALHWSAMNNDLEIMELLLYAGATVRPLTRLGGYAPLHLAARSGHADAVARLLEAGADPNLMTSTGVTALHFAAQADAAAVIEALVSHGGEVDPPDTFSGRTPLMFAAHAGTLEAMAALLAAGADPSLTTEVRDIAEIEKRDSEEQDLRREVRHLQNPETEPSPSRYRQASPDTATANAPQPAIRALSSEEQIGRQGGFNALHFAARQGHTEAARALLEAGADVNQPTAGDRSTPLLVSIINGNYDLGRMLLEAGADPNLVSDDGAGPLFATLNIEWSLRTWYPQPQAFRSQNTSYLELMQLLLDAGADPDQRTTTHIWYASYNAGRMGVDFTGATPFWRAAYAADVEAMRLLAENGADPNIWTTKLPNRRRFRDPDIPTNPDNDEPEPADPSGLAPIPDGGPGVHPIHAASGVGFGTSRVAQQHRHVPDGWLPAVRYLVEELGVDPNLRDMDGYSPLHHSAARGDNETILYLVQQGADVTLVSRRGQTTADMANSPEQRAQPLPATVALLEKLGSRNNHNCQSCGEGR